jgi:hypothetical protein
LAAPAGHTQSEQYRYKYISLTDVPVPPGYAQFIPWAIDDSGRVYGNVSQNVAVYAHGTLRVYQQGEVAAGVVNDRGTMGGSITDPKTYKLQAALFHRNRVELIPYLRGEASTSVVSLNDSDTALVWSEDPSGFNENTYRLYKNGKAPFSYKLPTGSDGSGWGVNNEGIVSGNIGDPGLNAFRAIRFQPPYRKPQLLDPLPTDIHSTASGINNSGNILGLSMGDDLTNNHIGIWDRKGKFKPYLKGACCTPHSLRGGKPSSPQKR